ncbi:hypothetical protein RM533_11770 [Croceicoccus sp. F390]|uniref:Secreted protein n=1 Tax=Croceicoccus esteveae TaxID=3075597 RepID=A0ABU2ZJR5_9SPHN|nr:hypothetical protein [Croceicoccus sp. F390]MDT0576850.1 hypothetical protein [Croceicoccus sp. F390]
MRMSAAALASAMAVAFAMPVSAQDAAEPSVNQVIVYGDQPCPPSTEEQITVCVRQEDPYRIPTPLRESTTRENEPWAARVAANADVGATGALTCSTVGPAAFTGCTLEQIEKAYQERASNADVRFGQLIAEERARRLAEIDEDAAAEQERVEQIEREYDARMRGEMISQPGASDASEPPADDAAAGEPAELPRR